jgi:hypothetical protein
VTKLQETLSGLTLALGLAGGATVLFPASALAADCCTSGNGALCCAHDPCSLICGSEGCCVICNGNPTCSS